MKLRTWLTRFGKLCPSTLAFPWDHCGYQTGNKNMDQEIHKVLLCLDYSEEVQDYAEQVQPDLIVSHHPFFFGNRGVIRKQDKRKAKTEQRLLQNLNCPLYSFHTSFDCCEGGMNDAILKLLGWKRTKVSDDHLMRFASLPNLMTIDEVAEAILQVYPDYHLGLLRGDKPVIQTIALVAGGAASEYEMALLGGADCYLSGDCAHHTRLDMRRYGLNYIDIPHECEEKGFFAGMTDLLGKVDPTLELLTYAYEKPFEVKTR